MVIPDNVEEIGSHSFYANYNLSSIQISNGLTVMPERAFTWAYELKSIVIPDGVEVVGYLHLVLVDLRKLFFQLV